MSPNQTPEITSKLVILGITGSIGNSALRVINRFQHFELEGFSYHSNFNAAKKIQKEYKVKYICCSRPDIREEEKQYWQQAGCILFDKMTDLLEIDYDTIITAIVGAVGVNATRKAVEQSKKVLLANKETLVMAGELIMPLAQETGAQIIPVDSEHSSVFRLGWARSHDQSELTRITLTASGGALRDLEPSKLPHVTRQQVLAHPTWDMGNKITVDSAAMINKALEIIEAHHLFGFSYDRLGTVIHPQSYVHAILEFSDGTWSFHVSPPDMVYPVAYGLFYPQYPQPVLPLPEIADTPELTFKKINKDLYPAFYTGLEAAKNGGPYPAVFNAANEAAVNAFLEDKIAFFEIPQLIDRALQKYDPLPLTYENLFISDRWARDFINDRLPDD